MVSMVERGRANWSVRRVFVSVAMGAGFTASSSSSTVIVSLMFFEAMLSLSSSFWSLLFVFSVSVLALAYVSVTDVCEALSERGAGEGRREGVSDKALRTGEVCADDAADAALSLVSSRGCESVRPEAGVVTVEGEEEDEACVDADEEDENGASTAGDEAGEERGEAEAEEKRVFE